MIRLSIIGSGNVAQHLLTAFSKVSDIELVQVFSRQPIAFEFLNSSTKNITNLKELIPVDLVIIAVTDEAIVEVAQQIPFSHQLVVHTSGSVTLDALDSKNRKGVFYPLQTFSKAKEVDFSVIPICIEATNDRDYEILQIVGKSISAAVYCISSEQRKALHVAAVFVANFVNHMYHIGQDICQENNLDFAILKPLIKETAAKIMKLSPEEAQTGPAKRQDTETINTHLSFLKKTNQKEIYKLLTKSIIDHGKKL